MTIIFIKLCWGNYFKPLSSFNVTFNFCLPLIPLVILYTKLFTSLNNHKYTFVLPYYPPSPDHLFISRHFTLFSRHFFPPKILRRGPRVYSGQIKRTNWKAVNVNKLTENAFWTKEHIQSRHLVHITTYKTKSYLMYFVTPHNNQNI